MYTKGMKKVMKIRTKENKNVQIPQVLYMILVTALLLAVLVIASYLAYNAIQYSCLVEYDQQIWLEIDEPLEHVGVFLKVCVAVVIIELLLRRIPKYQEKIGLAVLAPAAVAMAIMGFLLVRDHPYYPEGDQLIATAAASYFRQADYQMLVRNGYMGLYPQQKNFAFLYEILFNVFGDFCYNVAQRIHVCCCIVTLVCGYFAMKNWGQKVTARIVYCILMTCCLPFLLYIPYIYGDLPSVCFCMTLFWAVSAYEKEYRMRHLVIAAFAASLAYMVRKNVLIVLIALGIGMALVSLKKRSLRPLIAAVCILAVTFGTAQGVEFMYEMRSGYESDGGIPGVLWIAMGLQETDGMPGRYNRYNQAVYEEADFDRNLAAKIGMEYIEERIGELHEKPKSAKDFFHRKLQQQWLEPTFESFCYTGTFEEGAEISEEIQDLYYGEKNYSVRNFCNNYQSIVYLAFWLFVIGAMVDRTPEGTFWIPLIAITGGFLFSVIWESKCRYVFPYFMFMLLYVPSGLGCLVGVCDTVWGKVLRKRDIGK